MTDHNDEQSQHDGPHFGLILALVAHGLSISEYPEMVRVANNAESYGFGSVWLCDHFLTLSPDDYAQDAGIGGDGQRQNGTRPASTPLLEAWTTLSALARKAGALARPELLGNWLYGVAYRVASKARAGQARRQGREQQGLAMETFPVELDCDDRSARSTKHTHAQRERD